MPIIVTPVGAAVHEGVHQRTRQQKQPRQPWENVRAVFGEQEERSDDRESAERPSDLRTAGLADVVGGVGHDAPNARYLFGAIPVAP